MRHLNIKIIRLDADISLNSLSTNITCLIRKDKMSCCLRLSNEVVKSTIERERNRWNDNLATFWLKLRVEIFECADLFYFRPSVYFCMVNHFI